MDATPMEPEDGLLLPAATAEQEAAEEAKRGGENRGDGGDEEKLGKTVVVGVKADAQSRQLLTWALVHVASPGDRVVALHVISPPCPSSSASAFALDLDAMLAVYEGFCNLKQIDLKLKICKGLSIRMALVRETISFGASHLILGSAKHKHSMRSPLSYAKYCSKKLHTRCSVIVVSNGKIVTNVKEDNKGRDHGLLASFFTQEVNQKLSNDSAALSSCVDKELYCLLPSRTHHERNSRTSDECGNAGALDCGGNGTGLSEINSETQKNLGKDSTGLPVNEHGELYCLWPIKVETPSDSKRFFEHKSKDVSEAQKSIASGELVQSHDNATELPPSGDGVLYCLLPRKVQSEKRSFWPSCESKVGCSCDQSVSSCSVCRLSSDLSCSNLSSENDSAARVAMHKLESPSSSAVISPKESPKGRFARSLLRKRVSIHKRCASLEWPKISMAHWAMKHPSHCSSVYPDCKPQMLDAKTKVDSESETEGIGLVRTASISSFSFYEEEWPLKDLESIKEKYSSVCRVFSYGELIIATSNFSSDNLTGKGGTSRVYKACLSDGKVLAVKILKPSVDALGGFVSEVEILSTLAHKNIISLLGFCCENNSLMLVYDYLPKGSLEEILHGKQENNQVLSWAQRYKIATGVASALDCLHGGGVTQSVIHGDVKSSNILLAEDFEPKLCDFGLAKWMSSSTLHRTITDIAGTFGYLAPEYFMYGEVDEKIDVYAFGVVLLELVSGREPILTVSGKGRESLVVWAKPILEGGEIKRLVDPCLGSEYDSDQMERMTLAASLCTRASHKSRPHISLVSKLLRGNDCDVLEWARSQLSRSELDGSGDEAASNPLDIRSHLNLALLDIGDDSFSSSSSDHTVDSGVTSIEDYLERWSHSSSFD